MVVVVSSVNALQNQTVCHLGVKLGVVLTDVNKNLLNGARDHVS